MGVEHTPQKTRPDQNGEGTPRTPTGSTTPSSSREDLNQSHRNTKVGSLISSDVLINKLKENHVTCFIGGKNNSESNLKKFLVYGLFDFAEEEINEELTATKEEGHFHGLLQGVVRC